MPEYELLVCTAQWVPNFQSCVQWTLTALMLDILVLRRGPAPYLTLDKYVLNSGPFSEISNIIEPTRTMFYVWRQPRLYPQSPTCG